jgi:hypothetical protein
MIVAVRTMGMMHMPAHHVIKVISMRNAFVPAFRAVSVFMTMRSTFVVGRAVAWVGAAYGKRVLIDVAVMEVMQVTIVEIIRVPLVGYGHVPATGTMLMSVLGVLCALTFFHMSPFDRQIPIRSCTAEKSAQIRVFSWFPELIFGLIQRIKNESPRSPRLSAALCSGCR